MSHSTYVCNIKDRTCFDVGSALMTDDFEAICELVVNDDMNLEDFLNQDVARLNGFDNDRVVEFHEYLKSVPSEYYQMVHHEDVLCEEVFKVYELGIPVKMVGSLYNNVEPYVFGD